MFINSLKAASNLLVSIVMIVLALFSIGFLMTGIAMAYVTLAIYVTLMKLISALKMFINGNLPQASEQKVHNGKA
jgi:hypothetical protein